MSDMNTIKIMIRGNKLKKREEHKCFFVQAVFRFLSYNCVGGGGGRIFLCRKRFQLLCCHFFHCVAISFKEEEK